MDELFASPISFVIVGLFALALIFLFIALQQLQRGRSNIYWRQRRAAGQRGGQMFLLSLTLFGISLALAFFSGFASIALDRILNRETPPNPTSIIESTAEVATPDMESTVQFAVAATLTAQPTPIIRPLTSSNINSQITPTENPFRAFAAIQADETSEVTPNPESSIVISALSVEITDDFTAQSPQTTFPYGSTRLYIFFDYANIPAGILWTRTLYHENNAVYSRSESWPLDETGSSYAFIQTDFPPGVYELQISLGNTVKNSYSFEVLEQS